MEPSQALIDSLYLDKVRAARRMKPEEKLAAGAELFDWACSVTMAGIRLQNPTADERQVLQALRDRLAVVERREARA